MSPRVFTVLHIGRWTACHWFGYCPMCNSDAPALYRCKVCEFYCDWPPSKDLRREWWNRYAWLVMP